MKHLFIQPENSIKDALKQLSKGGEKCLLVIDHKENFLGTLSDGDVRKAILKGINISESIQDIFNSKATFLSKGRYTNQTVRDIFLKQKFDLIPIIEQNGKIFEILTWANLLKTEEALPVQRLNVPVVIMSGGRGTRLEPFTKVLPKPWVPVHETPIIEHIIERFTDLGCKDFYLTVNYKGKIIKAYFEELQPDYKVHFIEEKTPLGTAGSLRFLDGQFNHPFFVTNCDIIIKADYHSLYDFHRKGGYDITLVASAKEYVIPYGTCELNSEGSLKKINEKPEYNFLVNTGLYVLNPDVLHLIPANKDKRYHITHLIEDAQKSGKQIGVYPIDDDAWIDVGQWAEYQKVVERLW